MKKTPPPPVTVPTLNFGKIQLFVYDAGQHCSVGEHRMFQFGADKTAGLVYVDRAHGTNATDHPINNLSTWEWIGKWMRRGFKSAGLLNEDGTLREDSTPDNELNPTQCAVFAAACEEDYHRGNRASTSLLRKHSNGHDYICLRWRSGPDQNDTGTEQVSWTFTPYDVKTTQRATL